MNWFFFHYAPGLSIFLYQNFLTMPLDFRTNFRIKICFHYDPGLQFFLITIFSLCSWFPELKFFYTHFFTMSLDLENFSNYNFFCYAPGLGKIFGIEIFHYAPGLRKLFWKYFFNFFIIPLDLDFFQISIFPLWTWASIFLIKIFVMPLDLEKKFEIEISLLCLRHLHLEKIFEIKFLWNQISLLCHWTWSFFNKINSS